MNWALLLVSTAAGLFAQTVTVYSEYVRLDPSGNPVAPETPREILSPAVARNAFASFQIAVQAPAGTHFLMYVGQNPDKAASVALYRRTGDKLEPVELPYEGQAPQIFWMDVWIEKDAPVRRIKIEPQAEMHEEWITYPMEMRVTDVQVPDGPRPANPCGRAAAASSAPSSDVARLELRNLLQDAALAAAQSPAADLKKLVCDAPAPGDPESHLKIRESLMRTR